MTETLKVAPYYDPVLIDEFFGFSHPQNLDADMRAALARIETAAAERPPVRCGFSVHPDANEVA